MEINYLDIVLIITGCVSPTAEQKHLVLTNKEERIRQYKDSLNFFICYSPFVKIVFCENSDYRGDDFFSFVDKSVKLGKQIEIFSFKGDNTSIEKYDNKGLGEDEIMEYVFQHSKLLKETSQFAKVTGRLKILNITNICELVKPDKNYFIKDICRPHNPDGVDTRFYIANKDFFGKNLKSGYMKIDKNRWWIALEDLYGELLDERYNCLPRYPKFQGVSGGNGNDYSKISSLKYLLFDVLCRLRIFNFVFPLLHYIIRIVTYVNKKYENWFLFSK